MDVQEFIRRRELLNKKKEAAIPLPDGYTLGEYFLFDGSICSFGFNVTLPVTFEIVIEPEISSSWKNFLGHNSSSCIGVYGNKAASTKGWKQSSKSFFQANTPATVTGTIKNSSTDGITYFVNGEDTGIVVPYDRGQIFVGHNTQYGYPFKGNVYYLKVFKNGQLVNFVVPCFDSNNSAIAYDVVTKSVISASFGTIKVI